MRVQHVWFPNQLKNNINTAKKTAPLLKTLKENTAKKQLITFF